TPAAKPRYTLSRPRRERATSSRKSSGRRWVLIGRWVLAHEAGAAEVPLELDAAQDERSGHAETPKLQSDRSPLLGNHSRPHHQQRECSTEQRQHGDEIAAGLTQPLEVEMRGQDLAQVLRVALVAHLEVDEVLFGAHGSGLSPQHGPCRAREFRWVVSL